MINLHNDKSKIEQVIIAIQEEIGEDWREYLKYSCSPPNHILFLTDKFLYEKNISVDDAINNIDILDNLNTFLCNVIDLREVNIIEKDKCIKSANYMTVEDYEAKIKQLDNEVAGDQEQLYINMQILQTLNYDLCNVTLRDILKAYNKNIQSFIIVDIIEYALNNIDTQVLNEKHTIELNEYNNIIQISIKDLLLDTIKILEN